MKAPRKPRRARSAPRQSGQLPFFFRWLPYQAKAIALARCLEELGLSDPPRIGGDLDQEFCSSLVQLRTGDARTMKAKIAHILAVCAATAATPQGV